MNTHKNQSKNLLNKFAASIVNSIGDLDGYLRAFFWKLFLKKIGKKVKLGEKFIAGHPERIEVDSFTYIGANCQIYGDSRVFIGKYVMIANNCQIFSSNHECSDYKKPILSQGMKIHDKPVIVEDDIWIGNNLIILPEVKIGRGSIVGAGSVVTNDVKPFTIVAGVPAKFIKYRFSKQIIEKAKQITY